MVLITVGFSSIMEKFVLPTVKDLVYELANFSRNVKTDVEDIGECVSSGMYLA